MANVLNKTTMVYLESVDTNSYLDGNWLINPQVPFCDRKYWKIVDNTVVEMTQEEKEIIDLKDLNQVFFNDE